MSPRAHFPIVLALSVFSMSTGAVPAYDQSSPGQIHGNSGATFTKTTRLTINNVGEAQGISKLGERYYLYGDQLQAGKHKGVIIELNKDLKPTGRSIELSSKDKIKVHHPTGLTWHKKWGAVIGDTVNGTGTIYRIDWERALKQGNLENCILKRVRDDLAINGTRPVFVEHRGKSFLATADYGDSSPELRLYDPAVLLNIDRTSQKGVLKHRIPCGPYNQNLHFDIKTHELTFIQNLTPGKGWRLDRIDLNKLFELDQKNLARETVATPKASIAKFRISMLTIKPGDEPAGVELEGFLPYKKNGGIFVTSSASNNLVVIPDLDIFDSR